MPATTREVLANAEAIAHRAADLLVGVCEAHAGPLAVSLSGGSTPKRLYQLLASDSYRARLPWSRLHWFWGDERCVPLDSPHSNYRMVREAMLDQAPVPAGNVHPIVSAGLQPTEAATGYAHELQAWYGAERLDPKRPLFSLNFLGLGEDGHTASLFPGSPELEEQQAWTVAVPVSPTEPRVARVSLSLPAINASSMAVVLVSGSGKRTALDRIARGEDLPAARVKPNGALIWLLDRAAAGAA